ncbi:MAG: hypothetical protein RBS24_05815 [Bacilli bacterium]|jgi:hypothetical protein|nr:hypothetical protein [Bacilli bacterium]
MNEEKTQKRLFEYYNTLDMRGKRLFRDRVLQRCEIQYPSFFSWLSRNTVPPWQRDRVNEIINEFEKQGLAFHDDAATL